MEAISSILVLTGLILIIYWFINRKKLKQATYSNEMKSQFKRYVGLLGLSLLILGSLISPISTEEQKPATTPQKQSNPSSTKTSSSSLSYKKIKIGMTYNEMIKVAGKPDYDGYKDYEYVTYKDKNIYFKNGKVHGGNTKELMDQVKSSSESKKSSKQLDTDKIKSCAKYLGQKDVETLQKRNIYKSMRIDEGIMYTDNTSMPMLIRIDTDDGYTTVYEFNKNSKNSLGNELYTGKTIMQKQKPTYVYS